MITLWKESFNNSTNYSKTIASHLNSLILNTRKDHNLLLGTLEIHIQAWDSHRNVADLKQLLRSQPRGGGVPLKLEKIWFFGVKSWFFTRNTQQNFAPPSARHNFFKCTPPLTWNRGSAPATLSSMKVMICQRSRELPYYDCDVEQL